MGRGRTPMSRPEQASVTAQIAALQRMKVSELREKWRELYGEETRSFNRVFLWRRLAWRVQELAYGGLSERAKAHLAELSKNDDLRMLPPRRWQPPSGNGGTPAPQATRRPL